MNALDIRVNGNRNAFHPGEVIEGNVEWILDEAAEALELRLIWFTSGKGDTDVSIEDARRFEAPALSDKSTFRFQLPEAPYSFSGRLISLAWALELVVIPGEDATRYEFSLSPTGSEVLLPQDDEAGADPVKQLPPWLRAKVESKAGTVRGKPGTKTGKKGSALEQQNPFDQSTH